MFLWSVSKVVLNIKDGIKGDALLTLLRQMDFVEIAEAKPEKKLPMAAFLNASGIWRKRDIDVSSLRKKAWRNDSV